MHEVPIGGRKKAAIRPDVVKAQKRADAADRAAGAKPARCIG